MRLSRKAASALAVPVCILALALTGCSSDDDSTDSTDAGNVGGSEDAPTFEQSKLEDFLLDDAQKQTDVSIDRVACQGDLPLEENATQECAVQTTDGWQSLHVSLVNTDSEDPQISWQTDEDIIPEPDWVESAD